MADNDEALARERRRQWASGVIRAPLDHTANQDAQFRLEREFWQHTTAEERFNAVLEMAVEQLVLEGSDETPYRLCRTVGGLRKGRR